MWDGVTTKGQPPIDGEMRSIDTPAYAGREAARRAAAPRVLVQTFRLFFMRFLFSRDRPRSSAAVR
jgi:hypothetical protein